MRTTVVSANTARAADANNLPKIYTNEITCDAIRGEKENAFLVDLAAGDYTVYLLCGLSAGSPSEFMVNVLKAIKKVPGARTYVTADPSHEQFAPMWPYLDVWCCQPFVFGYEKIKRLSKEKGVEFWCCPNHICGENDHTPVRGARMTWGYGFWKSGFRTLIPWIYQADKGDPWNYLDSTAMDFLNRSTPDGERIPVTLWEAYREGIDDGRYIYTLKQLVEEAKKRGGEAAALAKQGERELKFLWDSIEVQEKYKHDGLWSGADFDAFRWLLASKILELQEALR